VPLHRATQLENRRFDPWQIQRHALAAQKRLAVAKLLCRALQSDCSYHRGRRLRVDSAQYRPLQHSRFTQRRRGLGQLVELIQCRGDRRRQSGAAPKQP
jgi:hypothetical protein